MVKPVYIIRSLSCFLLLVFALSITPKRFLHNAFAKHVDDRSKKSNDKPYNLTTSGYNCDNDNQVAESPFVSVQQSLVLPLFFTFPSYIVTGISFSSITEIYSPLRGPPVSV